MVSASNEGRSLRTRTQKTKYKEVVEDSSGSSSGEEDGEDFEVRPSASKTKSLSTKKSIGASKSGAKSAPSNSTPRGQGTKPSESQDTPDEDEGSNDEDMELVKTGKRGARRAATQRSTKPRAEQIITDDDSLFAIVKNKPNAVPVAIAKIWNDFSTGTDGQSRAVQAIVGLVVELAEVLASETSGDEAARTKKKGKDAAKLRSNLENFFQKFVEHAPREHLVMLHSQSFSSWLHAMCTSSHKTIRQFATAAGLQMLVGLGQVASDILLEISNKERQLQISTATPQTSAAAKEKFKRLNEELEELSSCKAQLEIEMDHSFNAFFVHRHRDFHPEIRAKCFLTLGNVITLYKPKFLSNSYLKYLGWALNDKAPEVRTTALEAILEIYKDENDKELDLFSDRFKGRFVDMITDVSSAVVVKAVQLCTLLAKRDILSEEQTIEIYSYITEDEEDVRDAVACFIEQVYFEGSLTKLYQTTKKASREPVDREAYMFKGMVELLHEVAKDIEDFTPIVKSLDFDNEWGSQNWSLMCETVLDNDGADILLEEQKETLVKIMTGALMCLESDKYQRQKKEPGTKGTATVELLPYISRIVKEWNTNARMMTALFDLICKFDLESLSSRHIKDVEVIVSAVSDAICKGLEADLLKKACAVLEHMSKTSYQIKPMIMPSLSLLTDAVVSNFQALAASLLKGKSVSVTHMMWIKRIVGLGNCFDLHSSHPAVWDTTLELLEYFTEEENANFSSEGLCMLIHFGLQMLAWSITAVAFAEFDSIKECNKLLDECVTARNAFLRLCEAIISSECHAFPARAQVMLAVSDCFHLFGSTFQMQLEELQIEETSRFLLQPRKVDFLEEYIASINMEQLPKKALWVNALVVNQKGYPEEEIDAYCLSKTVALSAVKPLLFCDTTREDVDDAATEASMMASFLMQTQYSSAYRSAFVKFVNEEVEARIETHDADGTYLVNFWLSVHQTIRTIRVITPEYMQMFIRIVHAGRQHKKVEDWTLHFVNSMSTMTLDAELMLKFTADSLVWIIESLPNNLGFLDALSLHLPKFSPDQINALLAHFRDLCDSHDIDIDDRKLPQLSIFRDKMLELKSGQKVTPYRERSAGKWKATVGADSSNDDSASIASVSTVSSQASRKRSQPASSRRKPGSAPRRVRGKLSVSKFADLEDDADDDGFVYVKRS